MTNPSPKPLLQLSHVSRHFGGLRVLEDVNLAVPKGSIFGLIGPNGAGKTTVLNVITGLLPPSSGDVLFDGVSVVGRKPHKITQAGIARTFQNIRIFKEMSLLDNVVVGMHSNLGYGLGSIFLRSKGFAAAERAARERALELLSWMRLEHKCHEQADNLSYGEQRRLELARALATNPQLLLLDEPVAGMNSVEKDELMLEIKNIHARGFTIFMIEHDMRFVMGLCSEIAVLNFGRIIAQGGPDKVRNDPQVIEAYLGRDDDDTEMAASAAGVKGQV
jgi:branched-chain amino acid transport system ATP-binding protein